MTEVSTRVRLSIIGVIIAALFGGLVARLWFLQVASSKSYAAQTQANRIRMVTTPASRGQILDRNGNVLVSDTLISSIELARGLTHSQVRRSVRSLAQLLNEPGSQILARINDPKIDVFQPVPIADNVTYQQLVYVKERPQDFPGVIATQRTVRTYPNALVDPQFAANLLGYVAAISAPELKVHKGEGYTNQDVIGKDGIESVFESELRGTPGLRRLEIDSRGRIVRVLEDKKPKSGNDVQLTLDANVQRVAEVALAQGIAEVRGSRDPGLNRNFAGTGGSAVVLDARDGSVVAMVSNPSYPVSQFTNGIPPNQFALYSNPAANNPLLNRATQGLYPPGSTFKMITAIAALQTQHTVAGANGQRAQQSVLSASPTFDDRGFVTFGGQQFNNAGKTPHGVVDLPRAIEVSSDVYFYNLGFIFWKTFAGYPPSAGIAPDHLAGDGIQSTAKAFGFGRPSGSGLPQEAAGRIPDIVFKQAINKNNPDPFSRQWLPGDNANVATGQGDVLVTPLQLADAYTAYENGGTLYSPRLASRILGPGGQRMVRELPAQPQGKVGLDPANRTTTMAGFVGAVNASDGTASAAFSGYTGLPVAGKTGTAQQPPPAEDTAWFVGMVNPNPPPNSNEPQYVVVVNVEQAGFGGTVAAPIARRIIEALSGNPAPAPVTIVPPQTD